MSATPPRTKVVTSPAAVAALVRGRGTPYLGPYFGPGTSIAVAAVELGEALSRVHHWTHRWHDLGLLEIASVQPRKGRAITHYRTTADAFEVPAELLPEATLAHHVQRSSRQLLRALEYAAPEVTIGGALVVHRPSGRGNVTTERRPAPASRVPDEVFHVDFTTVLTSAQARELRAALQDLHARWTRGAGEEGQATHLVALAVSPLPPP